MVSHRTAIAAAAPRAGAVEVPVTLGRLAGLEAPRYEGLVEFGPAAGGRWRIRLVVPVEP